MAGLLYALPNTQLSRRLEREGRLHSGSHLLRVEVGHGDQCTGGLNFDTKRPRQEVLADYRQMVAKAYTPQAFFGRLRRTALNLGVKPPGGRVALRDMPRDLLRFARVALAMTKAGRAERREFWGLITILLWRNPRAPKPAITVAAIYLHLGPFSRYVTETIDRQIEEVVTGRWQPDVPVQVISAL
jgi:hypothetical protein